jgi:hypothetical protein
MSDKGQPVSVVALRAECYSADGADIIMSLRMKYSTAERLYSVPLECFWDLVVDLQRLNASAHGATSQNADSESEPQLPLQLPAAAE